jgi:hypothetical protein
VINSWSVISSRVTTDTGDTDTDHVIVNLSATSCIIYSSSDFTRIRFIYLCDKNFYGTRYQVSYKGRAVWLSELVPLECLSS